MLNIENGNIRSVPARGRSGCQQIITLFRRSVKHKGFGPDFGGGVAVAANGSSVCRVRLTNLANNGTITPANVLYCQIPSID